MRVRSSTSSFFSAAAILCAYGDPLRYITECDDAAVTIRDINPQQFNTELCAYIDGTQRTMSGHSYQFRHSNSVRAKAGMVRKYTHLTRTEAETERELALRQVYRGENPAAGHERIEAAKRKRQRRMAKTASRYAVANKA